MAISKTYNPSEVEDKWYKAWMQDKVFASTVDPDKEPFTIVIPPPNVTGVLHMGHMLNNTIQDILVRRARMQGKEACWVPGTDHASIATETKVVNLLAEQGIKKEDLTREEFLGHAMAWKDKYGGIILEQLKKLGASCDWDREAFTMSPELSESVIEVFCELYEKGKIYRGARMVNWDPKGLTALSDEEVNHKEVQSKLYHIKYKVADSDEYLVIATTRPETLMGDTAICLNPRDERYTHLHGKKAVVPFVGREIPIILDEYVDIEFGTGCLKVTPAHDVNDCELGLKHNLEVIDIMDDHGHLNENAGYLVGENRFKARKKIAAELEDLCLLVKVEEIANKIGYSERTNEVIEPKLSTQWFCDMKDMAKPALDKVMEDEIQIHPPKFKNMYKSWMTEVKDWCISRQLWWGHRIPAYYLPNGQYVVAKTPELALQKAQKIDASLTLTDLKQDEDVLDTWFSSWLWPISVFGKIGEEESKDLKYYYPTDVLVTGFDIIFFWVARMIMAGYEFKGEMPFKHVYFTGMVRDEKGRKMSKSLGNSPDPLDLIAEYGADGVRVGMLLTAPAGNDLLFDIKQCEQGRNFSNKIWNAYRLVDGLEVDDHLEFKNQKAVTWFENRIAQVTTEVEDAFEKFRISDALMAVYKLIWDDFCSLYLEMVKPEYLKPIDPVSIQKTRGFFEQLMKLAHPFIPFITEELWAHLSNDGYIAKASYPTVKPFDTTVIAEMDHAVAVVSGIRNVRNAKNIPKKDALEIVVKTNNQKAISDYDSIIKTLANISSISFADGAEKAMSFVEKTDEVFVILGDQNIDVEAELDKIEKEIKRLKGFIMGVDKKLSNERFVSNAPEQVIALENKKKADSEAKIKALEESKAALV